MQNILLNINLIFIILRKTVLFLVVVFLTTMFANAQVQKVKADQQVQKQEKELSVKPVELEVSIVCKDDIKVCMDKIKMQVAKVPGFVKISAGEVGEQVIIQVKDEKDNVKVITQTLEKIDLVKNVKKRTIPIPKPEPKQKQVQPK